MSVFSSKKRNELKLIIEINSSTLRGSLVMEREIPHIVFMVEYIVPHKPYTDINYLIKRTMNALNDLIEASVRYVGELKPISGYSEISSIHFVLSSPWIKSYAKTINRKFDTDVIVNGKYILNLVEEEKLKMDTNFYIDKNDKSEIVEEKVFHVILNGYQTDIWEGTAAKNIETSFVVAISSENFIQKLKKGVEMVVSRDRVFFHSSLLLHNIAISDIIAENDTYILAYIHGEYTDVALVKHHSCVLFESYPIGVQTLIRDIAKATNTDIGAANSMLTLTASGHLDESLSKNNKKIVHDCSLKWEMELQKIISSSSPDILFEHTSLLISAEIHGSLFSELYQENHPQARIQLLSTELLENKIAYDAHSKHSLEVGLFAIAIHRIGQKRDVL